MKKNTAHFHGFSLIEVMIAVFVLSVGILAVAKFQGTLLQSGSETKAKTAAITLAEQKIDDLRGFGQLEAGTDCSGTCSWPAFTASELNSKQMAFAYIDDNKGGRLAPNATFNLSFNNENYKRTWVVKDEIDEPDKLDSMKWVKVSVAWQDQNGDTQTVSLESLIPAISPALTNVANPGAGASPTPPSFTYTPGAAPDVIKVEIDAGDGQFKETSKVLPDVSQDGDNNLVTFSAVTYTTSLGVSTADNIDEYSSINCKCTLNANDGSAYTPSRFVWNNSTKEFYDKRGKIVTKPTGTENNNGSGAETIVATLCTQCCRDHHDSGHSTAKYVQGTTGNNDHNHYDSGGNIASTGGDDYLEVCRFKSIDGILSTFQDWQLKTSTVLPSSYLADGTTTQAAYKSYVSDYLSSYTESEAAPTALTSRNITSLLQGGNEPLLVRAIYIDEVEDENSEYSTCANGIGTADDDCENVNSIKITPFTEINLTKLANWASSNCTDDGFTGPCVSNDAIVDEGLSENNYSRGLVTASNSSTPSAVATITASINTGNSGIVGELSTGTPVTDSVTATIGAAVDTFYITGNIGLCSITGQGNGDRKTALLATVSIPGNISYSGSSNDNCSVTPAGGNNVTMTCGPIPSLAANVTIAIPTTSPIASVTFDNSNNTNITGALLTVDSTICDY